MDTLLDILGAMLILGVVMLMALQLNIFVLESNTQLTLRSMNQEIISGSDVGAGYCAVIEDDLSKIGVGDTLGPSITLADTDRITFRGDMNGDGHLDSVRYYVTTPASLPPDGNHRLKYLYRKQNTQTGANGQVGVSSFRLEYLDDRGRLIPAPVAGPDLHTIRSVRVKAMFEGSVRLRNDADTTFAAAYWETLKSPVNVK